MNNAAIDVRELCFAYDSTPVLHNITMSIAEGEVTALLGRNGSGKSTLFRCILGTIGGYSGKILISGRELSEISLREMAGLAAYVPQQLNSSFNFTVFDMVLMGAAAHMGLLSSPRKKQLEAAEKALEALKIAALAGKGFTRLSGGEKRLVIIARALAQGAGLLILDEPAAELDLYNRLNVMEAVLKLSKDGKTVLFSTHDPQQALTYADRAVALSGGAIISSGKPEDVIDAGLVKALYGVDAEFCDISGMRVMLPCRRRSG